MSKNAEFPVVFEQLKAILKPFEPMMSVTVDGEASYSLDAPKPGPNNKPMFFGSAIVNKNYVSFHLMPVYVHPELLNGISEPLRKRMQGKSCFNFKAVDQAALAELAQLAKRGFDAYRTDGLV